MPPITPSPSPPQVARPSAPTFRFVELSYGSFALVWLGFLAVHGLCAFYFGLNALLYDKTPGSMLEVAFVAYKVGMPMHHYPVLTGVHAVFAAVHVLLGGVMVVWSLYKRRFSFGPLQELTLESLTRTPRKRHSKVENSHAPSTSTVASRAVSARLRSKGERVVLALASLFSRQGLFGVEGEHFEEILAVREIVESALQAYQAYRMSQFLVRPWLNRVYVAMLVVNCWMAPLVHLVFRRDALLRRALSLLLDAILDFTTAMVVPAVLLFSYYPEFDASIWGFSNNAWYRDVWAMKIVTEFQIMLVMSWGDLASRCVFSIGLISCIESAKELLRPKPPPPPSSSSPASAADVDADKRDLQNRRELPEKQSTATHRRSTGRLQLFASFRHARSHSLRRLLQSMQALCALLGVIVIVLHVYAESAPKLEQCLVQVYPWLERRPACVFLEWDCHANHETGAAKAITSEWAKSSPAFVRRLLLMHCPAIEMPEITTTFHQLGGVKVYNATIASWGTDAALTATQHPEMMLVYLVRVNMSDRGELPPGLVTAPFPPNLVDIEIAISNLRVLPVDLDATWPPGGYFICDGCGFTSLPPVLSRLAPYWMTFAVNPFTSFPFEVFQIAGLEHFHLGGVALPSLAPPTGDSFLQDTTLRYLYLPGTNLTWLPKWFDSFASLPRSLWYQPPLDLTATPICDAIRAMQTGTLERFPGEWTSGVARDQLSELMSVDRSNVSALASLIKCDGLPKYAFSIEDDDARYAVVQPTSN
ncbi:hypothetical protein PINS_up011677 [Pythium insidiosum]|nr:hypothetical protein PINS_up011677 [Pythium insidiosum]